MKKAFKKAAAVMALAVAFIAAAAAPEWFGYHAFDRANGHNVLQDAGLVKFRGLTPGEIEMSRAVYGDSIDYGRVRLFNRPFLGVIRKSKNSSAITVNGNIYLMTKANQLADLSQGNLSAQETLIHEMMHVWQNQHGTILDKKTFGDYVFRCHFNLSALYKYDLDSQPSFAAGNMEQQAQMAEDYWGARDRYRSFECAADGPDFKWHNMCAIGASRLRPLQKMLKQALPVPGAVPGIPPQS